MAEKVKRPLTSPYISAGCAGVTCIFTASVLLAPYFPVKTPWFALVLSLLLAVLVLFSPVLPPA